MTLYVIFTIQLGLEPKPSKLLPFDVLITPVDLKDFELF